MNSYDGSPVTLNISAAARPLFDEYARELVVMHQDDDTFIDSESNRQQHQEAIALVAQLDRQGSAEFTTTKRVGWNVLDGAIEEGLARLGNALDDRERMVPRFRETTEALGSLVAAYDLVIPAEPQSAGAVS